jgi:hypothetical protein
MFNPRTSRFVPQPRRVAIWKKSILRAVFGGLPKPRETRRRDRSVLEGEALVMQEVGFQFVEHDVPRMMFALGRLTRTDSCER